MRILYENRDDYQSHSGLLLNMRNYVCSDEDEGQNGHCPGTMLEDNGISHLGKNPFLMVSIINSMCNCADKQTTSCTPQRNFLRGSMTRSVFSWRFKGRLEDFLSENLAYYSLKNHGTLAVVINIVLLFLENSSRSVPDFAVPVTGLRN